MSNITIYLIDVFICCFLQVYDISFLLCQSGHNLKNKECMMLNYLSNKAPLDFDISANDILDCFRGYSKCHHRSDINYNYKGQLEFNDLVGTSLNLKDLIYYPELIKNLRKQLKTLRFKKVVNLSEFKPKEAKGLNSIIETLKFIENELHGARTEKAKLDSMFNNLIFLYGSRVTAPIFKGVKRYYTNRSYRAHILNISDQKYYFRYKSSRFGDLKHIYELEEYHLLYNFFENTKQCNDYGISRVCNFTLLGGIINTPIYLFRVRKSYKHKGRDIYFDLNTFELFTRKYELEKQVKKYTNNHHLMKLDY